jgi:hypothetical protein
MSMVVAERPVNARRRRRSSANASVIAAVPAVPANTLLTGQTIATFQCLDFTHQSSWESLQSF